MRKSILMVVLTVCLGLATIPAFGFSLTKSRGQTVHAPANHNCYFPFPPPENRAEWNCTLSLDSRLVIRNADLDHSLTVTDISLHDPDGYFIQVLLDEPLELQPLASATFAVPRSGPDAVPYWTVFTEGRPSFIVKWTAQQRVHPPKIVSSHAAINWAAGPSPNPIGLEGITVTPATILEENRRHR